MTYRSSLAAQKARGAICRFQLMDEYQSQSHTREGLAADYERFKSYYFDHNEDSVRELWFKERINAPK